MSPFGHAIKWRLRSGSAETECKMTDDGHREMQVSGLLPDSNELVFFSLSLSFSYSGILTSCAGLVFDECVFLNHLLINAVFSTSARKNQKIGANTRIFARPSRYF
jgi:hypothetical protein